jgi:hypothetical protein
MAVVPGGGADRMPLDAVGQCAAAVLSSLRRLSLRRRWWSFRGVAGAIVVRGRVAGFAANRFARSSDRFGDGGEQPNQIERSHRPRKRAMVFLNPDIWDRRQDSTPHNP